MDSQENILETGKIEEEVKQEAQTPEVETAKAEAPATVEVPVAEEAPAAEQATATEEVSGAEKASEAEEVPVVEEAVSEAADPAEAPERKVYETKAEILERVKDIAHGEEAPRKEEVDYLKTAFYKLHIAEREAKLKNYIEQGGDPEKYQITPDEEEEVFKAEMGIIRERRAAAFREMEAEKEENLKKKLDIIEKIKGMITSPEEANKAYQDFKALQQEWREIKAVPAEKANELRGC